MALYINGEKISEEEIKRYGLKAGMASPFSGGVISLSPQIQGRLEILKRQSITNR